MNQKHTWVATFDGASARVFSFDGHPRTLKEIAEERREGPHKPSFDERAGRVYSRAGSGRSSVEPHTDPERHLEDAFVAWLAEHLTSRLADNAFDELIVAAGPRALGAFRSLAPRALADKVVRELHGNYVNGDQSRLFDALAAESETKAE